MFKLDKERAEEPEIKLPTSSGSQKIQEESRRTSTSASVTMLKPLTVGVTETVENSLRARNTRPPYLPLRNLYAGQEATVRSRHGTTVVWFQIVDGVHQGCTLPPCLYNLDAEYIT